MSVSRKICFIALPIVILIIILGIFVLSKNNLTSHHASINMHFPSGDSPDQRLAKYERVIGTMKAWAADADMSLVEEGSLSAFTSNPDADVRECRFKDKLPSDERMPLEAMSFYDANASAPIVKIMFSQGISREPSERLKRISTDLHSRLVKLNEETFYSIW